MGQLSSRSPSLVRQEKALAGVQRHHGMGLSQNTWLCHLQTRAVPGLSLQHGRRPYCKTFSQKREVCLYHSFVDHCPRTQLSMGHTLAALAGHDTSGRSSTSHHSVSQSSLEPAGRPWRQQQPREKEVTLLMRPQGIHEAHSHVSNVELKILQCLPFFR